jgi:hypothetical protein
VSKYVEWIEPYYTYPDGRTIGPVYLKLSVEDAIEVRKVIAAQGNFTYENDQQALDDFIVVHWGKLVE